MAELTTAQRQLVRDSVSAFEAVGVPTPVDDSLDQARALVRAGMAQWYPPLTPMGPAAAATFTNDRTQITPTGRAQDWVDRYGG